MMMPLTPEMVSRLKFVTITKAAEYYNIDSKTVRKKINKNLIAYIKIDKIPRIAIWKDDYEKSVADGRITVTNKKRL